MNRLPLWTSIAALFVSVVLLAAVSQATIRPVLVQQSEQRALVTGATASTTSNMPAQQTSAASSATSSALSAKPKASSTAPKPKASTTTTLQPAATADFSAASAQLRAALVNIVCYAPASSSLHSISASGVIVDPKGVILTNAHVAQYFLLTDQGVSCVVRSGSPATDKYTAKLEYLSAAWVAANAGVLSESTPTGTGEHDYALLAITGSASNTPLPAQFPAISIADTVPAKGADVVLASYGAQFLNTTQIQNDLSPTVAYGSIKGVFTFATSSVDVLALGGSAVAQEGSSGGGVVDGHSQLVGLITTSTVTGATATRSVNAITCSYIQADFAAQTGGTLTALLAQNPTAAAQAFASSEPALEATILGSSSGGQ